MSGACCGFWGKIPARGDFVRAGLPAGFIAAWDGWLQNVILESRGFLGEDWLAAWLEAPVWRFALEPGVCGADAVLGLWMPSVDRAGRHYPLTLAAIVAGADAESLAEQGAAWLAAAERAGLEAVQSDTPPEQLAAALNGVPGPAPLPPEKAENAASGFAATSRWWTDGAPRVAARVADFAGLPDGPRFAAMLDDRMSGATR